MQFLASINPNSDKYHQQTTYGRGRPELWSFKIEKIGDEVLIIGNDNVYHRKDVLFWTMCGNDGLICLDAVLIENIHSLKLKGTKQTH